MNTLPHADGVAEPTDRSPRVDFATFAARRPPAMEPPRRLSSEQIFAGGAAEVQIEHHGALYRLRKTSLGKLILTK